MTDEEYLIKYQEKYGKLDDEDKEYVLKCKKETDSMTEEEFKKCLKIGVILKFLLMKTVLIV